MKPPVYSLLCCKPSFGKSIVSGQGPKCRFLQIARVIGTLSPHNSTEVNAATKKFDISKKITYSFGLDFLLSSLTMKIRSIYNLQMNHPSSTTLALKALQIAFVIAKYVTPLALFYFITENCRKGTLIQFTPHLVTYRQQMQSLLMLDKVFLSNISRYSEKDLAGDQSFNFHRATAFGWITSSDGKLTDKGVNYLNSLKEMDPEFRRVSDI
ncbi:MAG: hypothetical protein ACOYK9_05540 [Chlamydiia bacterium]